MMITIRVEDTKTEQVTGNTQVMLTNRTPRQANIQKERAIFDFLFV